MHKSMLAQCFFTIVCLINFVYAQRRCLPDQKELLLHLKNDLTFNSSLSTKLVQWNHTKDCCNWDGVTCDSKGRVIALDLSREIISGNINTSSVLFSFNHLETLNLKFNNLQSIQIPPLSKLTEIDLSFNFLEGNLTSFRFQELPSLVKLDLQKNSLSGNIPTCVFCHPSLEKLFLSSNQFSEIINELPRNCTSRINELDLSHNEFKGQFPSCLFQLHSLANVSLSGNFFNGTVDLDQFQRLQNLTILELSNNKFSVNVSNTSSFGNLKLDLLGLSSCNLSNFPDLRNQSNLVTLDLSSNQIAGEIPNWIWEIGNGSLSFLNLSSNRLTGVQKPFLFPDSIRYLDLHSNNIHGEVSIPESAFYIDYSNNSFDKPIPSNIGDLIPNLRLLNLAFNRKNGTIPPSLCNATGLQVLDLTNNNFSGQIPPCLLESTDHVAVLNLQGNNFTGEIPDTFPVNCSLQILKLGQNNIGGRIPLSLANCASLEVMDVRHNNIDDNFPCMLSSRVHVLVLRGNRFHGAVTCHKEWPSLRVIDTSFNGLTGKLQPSLFSSMTQIKLVHIPNESGVGFRFTSQQNWVYEDSMTTITTKRLELEISRFRILPASIDFSSNNFVGGLPDAIGDLTALFSLNLSNNALTGKIPKSFGNLVNLESLDFSNNQLSGQIPNELAGLTFISFMNLSYNNLSGPIPMGHQIQTLPASFFEGNAGLCGFPLDTECGERIDEDGSIKQTSKRQSEINWDRVSIVLGFSVGMGSILWLLFGCQSINLIFSATCDQFFEKWLKQKHKKNGRMRVVVRNSS